MRALLLLALLGLFARAQAQADWAACPLLALDAPCTTPTTLCKQVGAGQYCVPACSALALTAICYNANLDGTTDRLCLGQLSVNRRCTATSGDTDGTVRAATAADFWASCNDPNNCPTNSACNPVNGNDFCIPDCGVLVVGNKCYDAALGGVGFGATCDDSTNKLDPGLRCTNTAGNSNGIVQTLASWGVCDSTATSVDTCPGIQTCINSRCRPECEDLLEGQKCYDGFNKVLCNDGTFPTTAGLGCTTTNVNQDSVMMAVCDINSLCANTASPNNVCYDAGSGTPWAPCPTDLACIPDSTNSAGTASAQSYCRAACTPGSKTGLLTYQCREWGKNTCYCPGLTTFNNFLTDTTCAVMTTPIVEGRTATVGSWANTYCTPAEAGIDTFMDEIGAICPTVTITINKVPYLYEQCRKNGVPICACPGGTICDIGYQTVINNDKSTRQVKIGSWSNTYCVEIAK